MNHSTFKRIISLLLIVAVLLSISSCTIYGIGTATQNEINSSTASNRTNEIYSSPLGESLSKEEKAEFLECLDSFNKKEVFSLALECIAFDLSEAGYDTFKAIAIVGENIVPGIAFTTYDEIDTSDGKKVFSCGFLQVIDSSENTNTTITNEDVEKGVTVLPYETNETIDSAYMISIGVSIPAYSGKYLGKYFKYRQVGDYAIEIKVAENDRSLYDETIDLWDFDHGKFIFKGDLSYHSVSAVPYLSNEAKAYSSAREAINLIVEKQNSNSYKAEKQAIIIFTPDAIEEYALNNQHGSIYDFSLERLRNIEVGPNEVLVITANSVSVEPISSKDLYNERIVDGAISLIGGLLLTAGSIYISVVTVGASTPLAVNAICIVSAAGATLYGVSETIEGVQDIYYGVKQDKTEAFNPVLECFKKVISDDETATNAYHIWGISSAFIQSLVIPANAAISLSKTAGVTTWPTWAVNRAVAVEAVKIIVSGIVSLEVADCTKTLVIELTGDRALAKAIGFTSAIISGAFVYGSLNTIDSKYNLSGIHKKAELVDHNSAADSDTIPNGRDRMYEDWTRDDYLNNIDDYELRDAANKLYREHASIGDGGTADAVRYTKKTGELVGDSDHIIKAEGRIIQLSKIMRRDDLSYHDMKIAHSLLADLVHAIYYMP